MPIFVYIMTTISRSIPDRGTYFKRARTEPLRGSTFIGRLVGGDMSSGPATGRLAGSAPWAFRDIAGNAHCRCSSSLAYFDLSRLGLNVPAWLVAPVTLIL